MHRDRKGSNTFIILFYSILFYSILFYSILFYSILFYSILFYSKLGASITLNRTSIHSTATFVMNLFDACRCMQFMKKLTRIMADIMKHVGHDSSVGIATRFGLEGPEIESWWQRNLLQLSIPALGLPVQWVGLPFQASKATG